MQLDRRTFIKASSAVGLTSGIQAQKKGTSWKLVDDFKRENTLYHGDDWESLNPGYWQIKNNTLCRRVRNVGEKPERLAFLIIMKLTKKVEFRKCQLSMIHLS